MATGMAVTSSPASRHRWLLAVGVVSAALTLLSSCTPGSSADSDGKDAVLPPSTKGLLLLDCWADTASMIDPGNAKAGRTYRLTAKPTDSRAVADFGCSTSSDPFGSGLSVFSPDSTLVLATRSTADGSRHVGYLNASTGDFTDLSARLKLNANGEFTDEGSGADEFAGPITDSSGGFGADGTFYLSRAGKVYSAAAPAYAVFTKRPADFRLGQRLTDQGPLVTSSTSAGPLLQTPTGTPKIAAYNPGGASPLPDPSYAPVVLAASDRQSGTYRCDRVGWINAEHLLCTGSGALPTVLDLTGAKLVPATAYAKTSSCSECYQRQYVWVLPAGAARPLVPKTQRQLTGFVVARDGQHVLLLASATRTSAILYSASIKPGSTPSKIGTIELSSGAAPSLTYLTLQVRS